MLAAYGLAKTGHARTNTEDALLVEQASHATHPMRHV